MIYLYIKYIGKLFHYYFYEILKIFLIEIGTKTVLLNIRFLNQTNVN
jgi:hypothetical protein